jgi:hypothetical protein
MRRKTAIVLLFGLCAGIALWLYNDSPQALEPVPSPVQSPAPEAESPQVNATRLPPLKGVIQAQATAAGPAGGAGGPPARPDPAVDPMGWLRWKFDAKRGRSMAKLLRACPEAAVQATAIEELHRERDARLVEITQKAQGGAMDKPEFRRREKEIGSEFLTRLLQLLTPRARTDSCLTLLENFRSQR